MLANLVAGIAALPGWNISLLLLLTKATIILIAALGITLAMQRASAGARHLVWLVTLGTLLLAPILAAWAPLRVAILPPAAVSAASDVTTTAQRSRLAVGSIDSPVSDASITAPVTTPTPASLGIVDRATSRIQRMSAIAIAVTIWALVVLAIAGSLAWAGLAVRRIVRHARPLDAPDWVNPLFEIADRLGLEEAPRLLQSDEAKMPFACGVVTPTIVLPAEAEAWTLERRRAVLLHELAHVRRHDLLGHTLGRLACAVYWFHPLVWTAAKQLRNESERACDDLALSCGTRATDYAEHLLDIVTSVRGDSTPLVALAMARRKEFEGRMLAILDPHLRHSTPSRRQSAVIAGSLALLSLTVAAAAPVQREANAATLASATQQATSQPVVPMRVPKAYPDSGIPGVESTVVSSSVATHTAMATAERTDTSVVTVEHRSDATKSVTMSGPVVERAPLAAPAPRPTPLPVAAPAALRTSADVAIETIAKAGAQLGISVASSVLDGLAQAVDSKGAKGARTPDDRPVLLAKVLRTDTSASLRRIAAWGLQEYAGSPVASNALAAALKHDSDTSVREMAAWALGSGDDRSPAATSALTSAVRSDASEKVRTTSAWALGSIGDRSAIDALVGALGDASPDVRTKAVWAIGSIEPREAPHALVALLADKDERTRRMVAWALYQIEDPSAAPALEAALKTEQNKDLQLAYIRAIAMMGEKSVDAIRGLLESSDPAVKAMAVRALAGGHATGPWPMPMPMPRPFP